MINAIIFDWGGTLIDDPVPRLSTYCSEAFGVDKEIYSRAFLKHATNFHLNAISENELWDKVAVELNKKPKSKSLWKDAFVFAYKEKEEMFELARNLKKSGYKVGFLSNTEIAAMEFFREQSYDMFHETVFSCEIGLAKPDKKIFEHTVKKLGVKPEEAVFIDDNKSYLDGAKKAGLETILFDSPEQVVKELKMLKLKI